MSDKLDEMNAFRAGFRHGKDRGIVSAVEADALLRGFGRSPDYNCIACFCNGAEDGARNDQFRYLLSYAVVMKEAQ